MKSFFRKLDGHTYYQDADGDWLGAPTNLDGTFDPDTGIHLVDMDLDVHELASLHSELWSEGVAQASTQAAEIAAEGGADDDAIQRAALAAAEEAFESTFLP